MHSLVPLFLIAGAAVGVEIALTRFFAVASWSEYGYWVISIAMTGFAVSGVVMVIGRAVFLRHARWLLPLLPVVMLAAGGLGWIGVTLNGFNPLELQNPATAGAQLWNIALYYAALFPFFFLAGLAVSLNFVVHAGEVGRVYGYDLLGAGTGAVLALGLMFVLHPFALVPALLPLLAVAAMISGGTAWRLAALLVLAATEAAVLALAAPRVNEFKPIYAPLNVPESRVVAEVLSPRGVYLLLDNFTERLDTDVSNNAGTMGLPAPPRSFGLYRDGARIAALPMGQPEAAHARAALDAAPYVLIDAPRVLALGSAGGFRAAEALALGAARVTVIEPEPVIRRALTHGLGPSPAPAPDPRVRIAAAHPLTATGRYDLVDIAGDFLGADEQNRTAYTAEALAGFLARLEPGGMVSVPIGIRELPVYAVRVLATAREALRLAGAAEPERHVAVIRSAWNLRVLIAREPFDAARVERLAAFADERSFDLSYAPGLAAEGREVWNDLPPVSLESDTVDQGGEAQDAVAREAALVLAGTPPADAFDRSPVTADRPWLSPLVRLPSLGAALARIEILPQQEIGLLVNVAVLAQAILLALVVSLLPLAARGALRVPVPVLGRALVYFPALGLGFLLIEIAFIEHAALLLGDRTSGFALVLTTMLVFSGLGAMWAGRVRAPGRALGLAVLVALGCSALALLGVRGAVLAALDWPWALRAALLVLALAPISLALGFPFPLGLDRFQQEGAGLLPWAWALNGAFSVVATPLANLLGHGAGLSWLLAAGMCCYAAALIAWPGKRP
ncbi:hypothetical protein GXW77_14870 [Roseomonas alkaliterrae]|uniref:Spermidine synthase n=1 Tax=Neoroseomonas alkaliterrae TaxID=1452450 RepID=A0A840XJ19_9PROT|nr:hypothetical protein [Neoroseomonas alkaliterrae]MBB5688468.1 hypothetical protein [Neoroseomonas alkaliterrae]MBR0677460.1 hypothetical protein [Neoroseomonas alkaliterrae]